jgi:hypothetical protein
LRCAPNLAQLDDIETLPDHFPFLTSSDVEKTKRSEA